jgi:hypothetical protein
VYIRSTPTLFQANSKFSQIEQSPANAEQNPSKKKAWISLDSLVRIEPFQTLALTPWAFFLFSPIASFRCAKFQTPSRLRRVAAREHRSRLVNHAILASLPNRRG